MTEYDKLVQAEKRIKVLEEINNEDLSVETPTEEEETVETASGMSAPVMILIIGGAALLVIGLAIVLVLRKKNVRAAAKKRHLPMVEICPSDEEKTQSDSENGSEDA